MRVACPARRCTMGIIRPMGPMALYAAYAWAGCSGIVIRPYFFIFLYSVTRLMPSESAARVRLKPLEMRAR